MQEQPTIRDAPTSDAPLNNPNFASLARQKAIDAADELRAGHRLPFVGKTRAGFTTNKGHGTPKAKRKQAAASRHRNRGK